MAVPYFLDDINIDGFIMSAIDYREYLFGDYLSSDVTICVALAYEIKHARSKDGVNEDAYFIIAVGDNEFLYAFYDHEKVDLQFMLETDDDFEGVDLTAFVGAIKAQIDACEDEVFEGNQLFAVM